MLSHGGTYGAGWWRDAAGAAGFEIRRAGFTPRDHLLPTDRR